jgi:hypothetical protein
VAPGFSISDQVRLGGHEVVVLLDMHHAINVSFIDLEYFNRGSRPQRLLYQPDVVLVKWALIYPFSLPADVHTDLGVRSVG